MYMIDNDLLSIQEARILAENAREAQKKLATFSQEKLDVIIEHMAKELELHSLELAKMSCNETDYGRWQDKYIKNRFICKYLPERLRNMTCVGIIKEDKVNRTMEIGVPIGVIVALCPATNPVSTSIYKAMLAVKSGNAIIFSPHPRAKMSMITAIDLLIKAACECGLPEGAISVLRDVTPAGTLELLNHKATTLIMNTGVPGMLRNCTCSGKPVIYGGAGNGPAFIERTADISQAVKDIIASKTFDYGVVSAAEQSVVVDRCIETEVKAEFLKRGAYFMTEEEALRLGTLLYQGDGSLNPELVGKAAKQLAKRAGFIVPEDTVLLISEQKYVNDSNSYSKEKLCPVLAYYIEDDWMHACEKCIELLLSERNGHTLVIHSKDEAVIRQFAIKKPVGRVLVNTPAIFGSMGMTTDLFPAMTLGSGSAGVGITSDNVSPMNLIYIRKVGYGVRSADEITQELMADDKPEVCSTEKTGPAQSELQLLQRIISNVMESL